MRPLLNRRSRDALGLQSFPDLQAQAPQGTMARQLSWKRAYLKGLACVEEDGFISCKMTASAHEVCHRGVNMNLVRVRRILRRANRRIREARMLVRSLRFRYQPVAAHIIPIRRCNLSCTYCNEYDDRSTPVPTADMLRRIDRLAGWARASSR